MGNRSYRFGGQGQQRSLHPAGHTQDTVSGVTKLAGGVLPADNIERVTVRVSNAPVRFRDDGVDPTGTTGFPLLADETITFDSAFDDIRFIADATAVGTPVLDSIWFN